ncbi:MAG TPA: YdcF family protein [Magnetovibrio sp.]
MGADVYFLFAKAAGLLLTPSALFVTAVALGTVLLFSRRRVNVGRALIALAMLGYLAVASLPLGEWAVAKLEDRFATVTDPAQPVTGIIVLGGSFDTIRTRTRGQVALTGSAERLVEFVRLARLYPQAKLVFSGGSGQVFDTKPSEAEVARTFFADIGFDASRVQFEGRSRNTAESASLAFEQFSPQAGETWLLITSARHMPRAVGLFRQAGWTPTAHPVDYLLDPDAPNSFAPSWPGSLVYADAAAYEWGGLVVAWLRGRSADLFPGPSQ